MLITCSDDVFRYEIEAPDHYGVKLDHADTDFVIVPDPTEPDVPFWLSGFILVEAARDGEFGLRLVWEEPV